MKLPILISTGFAAIAALTLVAQDNYPAQNYSQKKQALDGRINDLRVAQSTAATIQSKIDQRNANIEEYERRIEMQNTRIARASAGGASGKNANIIGDAREAIVTANKLKTVEAAAIVELSKELASAEKLVKTRADAVEGAKMQYENAFNNLPQKERKTLRDQAIGNLLRSKPPGGVKGWRCNYVNAVHATPQECDHPEMGGKWIN